MYATERKHLIQESLVRDRRVVVTDLAQDLGVTTETIRRDLAQLETQGVLQRVHGGAIPAGHTSTEEPDLTQRATAHGPEKHRIGQAALKVLGPHFSGSLLLDAGTTVTALAQELEKAARGRRNRPSATQNQSVQIVTHAVGPAAALSVLPGVNLTTLGGRVRGVTGAAVGPTTVNSIMRLRPDVAFVGTNGISAGFGLSTPDPEEAAVKRAIVRAARRVVLLADASKFGVETLEQFATLEEVDLLITDTTPSGPLAEALTESDVEVWTA
ncbi:MAG: DeoR/GlpR family DNA-binding transcription regulator [Galactobacter sp.]